MMDTTNQHARDGICNRLNIGLEHDSCCANPLSSSDGMWTLHSFNPRHTAYREANSLFEIEMADWRRVPNIGMIRKLTVGTAFMLDYYEHGGSEWSIGTAATNGPFNYEKFDGVLVWEHDPSDMGAKSYEDRKKDAQATLAEYNAWANGNCYGFNIETADGEDVESCWGFIDSDRVGDPFHLFAEMNAAIIWYMNKHGFESAEIVKERDYPMETDPDNRVLYLVIGGDSAWLADHYTLNVVEQAKERKAA